MSSFQAYLVNWTSLNVIAVGPTYLYRKNTHLFSIRIKDCSLLREISLLVQLKSKFWLICFNSNIVSCKLSALLKQMITDDWAVFEVTSQMEDHRLDWLLASQECRLWWLPDVHCVLLLSSWSYCHPGIGNVQPVHSGNSSSQWTTASRQRHRK